MSSGDDPGLNAVARRTTDTPDPPDTRQDSTHWLSDEG